MNKTTLYILVALARQPMHGYAIMKQVGEDSAGDVALGPGTLYGTLKRLLEDGWVAEVDGQQSDRARRYYELTDLGRRNLGQELDRLRAITKLSAQLNLAQL